MESREPANIVRLHTGSGGDHRRVLVLPEIHMKDFTLDTELLEGLTQGWEGVIELGDIEGVLEHLSTYFTSDDWQERLQHIENMDFEKVEKKMKEVERRLQQLESELEEKGDQL